MLLHSQSDEEKAARVTFRINGGIVAKISGKNRYGNWRDAFVDVIDVLHSSLAPEMYKSLLIERDQGAVWDEIAVKGALVTIENEVYMVSSTTDMLDRVILDLDYFPTTCIASEEKNTDF